jgi:hypothetical protein
VADSFAIGFAFSKDFRSYAPFWAPSVPLLTVVICNAIMLLNFWKYAYRSYYWFLRLQRIELAKGLRRLAQSEPPPQVGHMEITEIWLSIPRA